MRTSGPQYDLLITYMEQHGDLSKPTGNACGKARAQRNWETLVAILNSESTGDSKSLDKWKKVWSDFKNYTKKKASKLHRAASATGGGPAVHAKLSDFEARVLAIIGVQAATGLTGVDEAGFFQTPHIEEDIVLATQTPEPVQSRPEQNVLVEADLEEVQTSPQARIAEEVSTPRRWRAEVQTSPQARIAEEVSTPRHWRAEVQTSPQARIAEEVSTPRHWRAEVQTSPQARIAEEVSTPRHWRAEVQTSPQARIAEEVSTPRHWRAEVQTSPQARIAEEVSTPRHWRAEVQTSPQARIAEEVSTPRHWRAEVQTSPQARIAEEVSTPRHWRAEVQTSPQARIAEEVSTPRRWRAQALATPHPSPGRTPRRRTVRRARESQRRHVDEASSTFLKSDEQWRLLKQQQHKDWLELKRDQMRMRELELQTQNGWQELFRETLDVVKNYLNK